MKLMIDKIVDKSLANGSFPGWTRSLVEIYGA